MVVVPKPDCQARPARLAPAAVIGRVGLYLRQLERLHKQGQLTISSRALGEALALSDAQVRKDLAFFGQFGQPGIGYRTAELITQIREILGVNRVWPTVLVGFGNLGRALLGYRGFTEQGFRFEAVLDRDFAKVGQTIPVSQRILYVEPMSQLESILSARSIQLALLCVPAEEAQQVTESLVRGGIAGIFNFAPTTLEVPESVSVLSIDLSVELEQLAYRVLHRQGGSGSPATEHPI